MNIKKRILGILNDNDIKIPNDIKLFLEYEDEYSLDTVFFNICFILNEKPYYARTKSRERRYIKVRHYFYIVVNKDRGTKHNYTYERIALYFGDSHSNVLSTIRNKDVENGCPQLKREFKKFYEQYLKLTEDEQTNGNNQEIGTGEDKFKE
jgi:hypothetical protein